MYPHDELVAFALGQGRISPDAMRWRDHGVRHWRRTSSWAIEFLAAYEVGAVLP